MNITALYNYWGSSTGPFNPTTHPSGAGDWITTGAITFSPYLDKMHYLNINSNGVIVSGVHSMQIRYSTSTSHLDVWYPSVATWNTQGVAIGGGVNIATSTVASTSDLVLSDIASTTGISLPFVAAYSADHYSNSAQNYKIYFNDYWMGYSSGMSTSSKQSTATHELGHALGLYHSFLPNVMTAYSTEITTLGAQDILDYNYMW